MKNSLRSMFKQTIREVRAVDGMDMYIAEGEILGLIGPNGAGKSTIVKVLTGILTPTSGTATVDGIEPYKERQEVATRIGVVFGQRTRLWWLLPVSESLEYFKALYSIPEDTYKRNVDYLRGVLDLDRLFDKPVRTLSLGERMRVEIATSLLHDPKLLYLDEPTVGLDVVGKNELRKLIRQINQDRNVSVLLVTHDVIDIEKLCSRIIVIDKGRQIWEGDIAGLHKFHGKNKTVVVDFADARTAVARAAVAQAAEAPDPIAMTGVELVSQADSKHEYLVDLEQTGIDEFIQAVSARGRFTDLQVIEQEIEEVIREIYKS